jgi:peroxiredoxin
MKLFRVKIICILFVFAMSSFQLIPQKTVPDFTLRGVNGRNISTKDYKNAKGFIVIFTCNHCPFAKLYTKRMNDLNTKFTKLNVPLIAINSMDTMAYEDETFSFMQQKAKKDNFNFPYLQDETQYIGKLFGAEYTPVAYVIWKENNKWVIKYKGAIDNNGEHPAKAEPYLANAVKELLQNQKVTLVQSESFGCRIYYRTK